MSKTVIERLLATPQGFNLFQAISLLESSAAAGPASAHAQMDDVVRLGGWVTLSFEASDIRSITSPAPTGEPFLLRTPVLSLAGAGGPLPQPFTELLLERQAKRDHAMADFLDIFNHRFLAFLYRSRRKHHIALNRGNPSQSSLASTLDALSALGHRSGVRAPDHSAQWLRHAGLFGGAPRSMTGLVAILRDRLNAEVHGTQFRGAWLALESDALSSLRTRGPQRRTRLGQAAVLGRRVWDQGAGLQLDFTRLDLARLQSLLPGGKDHLLTQWLVRRYVPQHMDVRVVLHRSPGGAQPSLVGGATPMRLGWTSWLAGRNHPRPLPPVRLRLTSAPRAGTTS